MKNLLEWFAMHLVDVAMLVGVLIQIGLLVVCGWMFRQGRSVGLSQAAIVLLLAQALAFSSFMVGKGWEHESQMLSSFRNLLSPIGSIESPSFPKVGDPGLVKFASQTSRKNIRPNFRSRPDFDEWQNNKRQLLQTIFNFTPSSTFVADTENQYVPEERIGSVVRHFITFKSFDGTHIPGYLLVPQNSLPQPGILVLPGHVQEGEEGILQTAGFVESYQHNLGLEIAKAGFVVLAMEFRGFGTLGKQVPTEHRVVAYNALLGGSFYKAIVSKDISLAVAYLQSRKEVDPERIGITGVSYGGEMAMTYAALDPRIKVVVSQGYGGRIGSLSGKVGTRADQPHYCHFIPGFQQYFSQEDLPLLVAPRPLLGVRGTKEGMFKQDDFKKVISKAYSLLDATIGFELKEMDGGHEYFVQPAVEFFRRHL